VAYVSQQAWVQQGTLRDNICFGKDYNEKRFSKVIYACALERDLDQLPGRDMAELGGKVRSNSSNNKDAGICCAIPRRAQYMAAI